MSDTERTSTETRKRKVKKVIESEESDTDEPTRVRSAHSTDDGEGKELKKVKKTEKVKKEKRKKKSKEEEVVPPLDEFDQRTIDVYAYKEELFTFYSILMNRLVAWQKEGKTNHILFSVFVNDLHDLNSQDQTVFVEINFYIWYINPDQAGLGDDKPDDLWDPAIEIVGSIDVEEVIMEGKGSYYVAEEWKEHGIAAWYQKYRGTLRAPMNLRNFPFDRQSVKIKFGSKFFGADTCTFVNYTDPDMIKVFSNKINLTEWKLTSLAEVRSVLEFNEEDKRDVSIVEIELHFKRLTGYYLKNIIGLLCILAVVSWAMYIVPPYVLNDRLQISITLFLAQVAFNFVIAEQLPRISYGTYLTLYFLLCYSLIGVGAVENVISYLLNRYHPDCNMGDKQEACTLALKLDFATLGIVASLHTIITLIYIYLGRRRLAGEVDHLPSYQRSTPARVKVE